MTHESTNLPPSPTDHAGRFQFSLKQLFLAVLAICLVLGVYTWLGHQATGKIKNSFSRQVRPVASGGRDQRLQFLGRGLFTEKKHAAVRA